MTSEMPTSSGQDTTPHHSRRDFLRSAATATAGFSLLGGLTFAGAKAAAKATATSGSKGSAPQDESGEITFGIVTDLHHGLAPDATQRLQAFMEAVDEHEDLAFIAQLGDFCHPTADARDFVSLFDQFPGRKVHVLGNHDMDKGTKSETMRHWGMESRFGSFDAGDFHFVVLDLNNIRQVEGDKANYTHYDNANFYIDAELRGWADPEQLAWLVDDLAAANKQTIVFSHQPLGFSGPDQPLHQRQQEVLDILYAANREARRTNPDAGQKVVACLSGHLHVDRHERHNEVHCLSVNSASYHWAGGMHPYADPLFCFVTINPAGRIYIRGQHSEFTNAHPWQQGLAMNTAGVTASISDRAVVYRREG